MQEPFLTNQQIFEKASMHLLTQNNRAGSSTQCMYHARDGRMCAIGVLILKENYTPLLEQRLVTSDIVLLALKKSGVNIYDNSTYNLLVDLQQLHDVENPETWRKCLVTLSEKYSLKIAFTSQACKHANG